MAPRRTIEVLSILSLGLAASNIPGAERLEISGENYPLSIGLSVFRIPSSPLSSSLLHFLVAALVAAGYGIPRKTL